AIFSRDWSSDVCSSDLVATSTISYGETFSAANVHQDWRDVTHSEKDSLSAGELTGFSSNRMIALGQVIRRRDMVKTHVVKFGDEIGRAACRECVVVRC